MNADRHDGNAEQRNAVRFVELSNASAPAIIGHYCHAAVMPNGLIHLSGQKAWAPDTGKLIVGGIAEQTTLVLQNIKAILEKLHLDFHALTRTVCHLHSVEDYEAFNRAYSHVLGTARPTRTVLAGARLRDGALVEIVADAFDKELME